MKGLKMKGFSQSVEGKKLPLVTVFERQNKSWLFRIITEETILDLEEKDAKRLYRQLHTAFRPTKRAPDAPKRGAKVVKSKSKVTNGLARR